MGLTGRRGRVWRGRSQAVVALVVIAAWFGTLLVAAPSFAGGAATDPSVPTSTITAQAASGTGDPTFDVNGPGTAPLGPDTTYSTRCTIVASGTGAPAPDDGSWVACGPSYTPALTADGTYDAYVETVATTTTTTTDPSDSSTATTTTTAYSDPSSPASYTRTPPSPAAPSVSFTAPVPTQAGPATGFDFAVSAYNAQTDSFMCGYDVDSTAPSAVSLTPCTSPYKPFGSASTGDYVVVVQANRVGASPATDLASTSVHLDADAPVIGPITVDATDPQNPVWSIAVDDSTATVMCDLPGVTSSPQVCGSTFTRTLPAGGTYTLTVTATDPVGNAATPVDSVYVYDTTGPTPPTVSPVQNGANGYAITSPITWDVAAADPADTKSITCVITYGASTISTDPACSGTVSAAANPGQQGTWTLTATAYDAAHNASAPTVSQVTFDSVLNLAVTSVASSDPKQPTWHVAVDPDATATCSVAGVTSGAVSCGGSDFTMNLANKPGGHYTLVVDASDTAGNTTSTSVGYDLAPDAPIVSVAAKGNDRKPVWTITAQPGASLSCTLVPPSGPVQPNVQPCQDGMTPTLSGPDGVWNLQVVATASVSSAPGTSAGYALDTTPPGDVTLTGPTGPSNAASVTWNVTAGAQTTSVTCVIRHNGTVVSTDTTCGSTVTLTFQQLASEQGTWSLTATGVDDVGNTSVNAATRSIDYDSVLPAAPGVSRISPSPTSNQSTTWSLSTAENPGTFLCRWTGTKGFSSPATACASLYNFDLPLNQDDTYTLFVAAVDAAGNVGPETATTVVYDTTPPTTTFTSEPTTPRNNATVSWTTTVNEPSAKTECQLTMKTAGPDTVVEDWGTLPCGRTVTRTLAADGLYALHVRDTDPAGNVDPNGTTSQYVALDRSAPGAPTVTGPVGYFQDPNVSWTINPDTGPSADPSATYLCRLDKDGDTSGAWVSCDSDGDPATGIAYAITLTGDGAYQLDVEAKDPAGNLSTPIATSGIYTLDRVAPAQASFVGANATGNTSPHVWSWTAEANATADCRLYTVDATGARTLVRTTLGCTSPDSESLAAPTAGTTYVLEVTLTDRALNVSAPKDGPTYVYDTSAPAAPDLHGPSNTSKNPAVQYTFTAEPGSTAACRLLFVAAGTAGPPAPFGSGAFTPCTSPWSPALNQGDGRYRAEAHVTDAAGNQSIDAQSEVFTLDTTGPLAPVFTAQPTGTDNVPGVSYTWTGETPSTGTCTLRFTPTGSSTSSIVDGPVACDSQSYATTLTAGDGFYQLSVQLTDPWTNAGTVAVSTGYTLDMTPPGAPTVTGPTGTSNKTSADYAISSPVEPLATAECKLTRDTTVVSDWGSCTMPRTIALNGDGSYVLQVRLTDQYGNLGPAGSSPAYLLDTKLPTVPVVTVPTSPSSNAAPSFSIQTDSDTTMTCRLSRGSVVAIDTTPCTATFVGSLAGQPDGDYVLSVTATDPAGNTATGTSAAYTFDTTKPIAPVVTGPAGPSQTRNPVFSWTGEAGAQAQCSLQEKAGTATAWTACASPYAPALPSDGSWVLSVRLSDAAANVSDAGASGAYIFDTTAPAPPSVTAPTSPGRDLAPSWSAATEEGSTVECRLSGPGQLGQWGPCTLPMDTPLSVDGLYTFEVRATDAAGNVSTPGSGTYLLDTTAPPAPVVTQPTGPGRTHTPSISFTSEAGTTGSCRLTHGTTVLSDSAVCSSPATLDLTGLADGAYTLSVRAVDAAGNIGPAGTATYVLDTTAPVAPTMTLIPGSPSSDHAPVFGFNSEQGTTVGCKLTMPSGAVKDLTCVSPVTADLSGSPDGDYVFAVRATDPAGNVGPAATVTYHLDSNAPAAPRVVGPTSPGSIRNPVWKISSSKAAECRLTRGTTVVNDWAPCATSYSADLYSQPDGPYVLEARVIGTTAATASRYRLDTAGPAAATIVGPPSPSTNVKPIWAVSSPDTTVKAECRVLVFTGVLKDWAPCGVSPAGSLFALDLTGMGDGTYTLVVRLTDAAGNLGPTASSDYVLDTSAPAAVGVIAPLSPGNDTTPTWTLTSATGVKLECRLSSGQKVISDFAPCAGTFTADLTGLPDGTYTLTVHALSAAGTPGPETTSGYILDTTAAGAPGTLSGPTGPSRDRAPRWTFSLAPGTTATCHVTVGGKVYFDGACTSPFVLDLSNAADGTYTITVRAVDAAGNLGSPSTAGYILKTTPPPAPVLTMQPGSPSSTTDPSWGFSLFRGTTAQCRLLQGGSALEDWHACTSPVTALLSGKPDGAYTMQVRAIDVALNTSSAVSGDYTFDRSAEPLAKFVETPATPSNDTSPTWVVAAPAAVSTPAGTAALIRTAALTGTPQTECRLTTPRGAGSWQPCAGSYTATTNGDGSYLLEVRAFDSTGARGPASTSTYVLDTRAPAAPRFIDPIPPAVGNDAEVAWSWAEDADLVQCHLLRNGVTLSNWTACDPPYVTNVGRLGEASYTIEARAVDAAGNVGPISTAAYRYDITPPPAPSFVTRPASRGAASSVTWTFAVPLDTGAVCVVTRNGTVVSEGSCNGAFTLDLRGQQPASWAMSAHFVDAAGNVGPSTVGTYTLTSPVGGRVGGGTPGVNGPSGVPGGSGPAGGAPVPGATAAPHSAGLDALKDTPRAGAITRLPALIKKGVQNVARATGAIPGALPGTDVPKAIKNVLGQTITKPQLPLALFVIVLLFLLVQNRIDRRDPKLAAAPVTAEPELTFGPVRRSNLRPGGATA